MFGKKNTVDAVLSSFNKAVEELNKIVAHSGEVVDNANADIVYITETKEKAIAEGERAAAIAIKINKMITV